MQVDFSHKHNGIPRVHLHKGYVHMEEGTTFSFTKRQLRVIKKVERYIDKEGLGYGGKNYKITFN